MRRFAPLLLLLAILAACAPAAGRPAIPYRATSSEIIGAIAQFGPQIQPGRSYNYFSTSPAGNDDLYELFVRELDRRFERAPVGFLL